MANEDVQKLFIPRAGLASGEQVVRGIHSSFMNELIGKLGDKTITRASNVEPLSGLGIPALQWLSDNTKDIVSIVHDSIMFLEQADMNAWYADMLPVGGPVLGPFPDRAPALEAEEKWLLENNLPLPNDLPYPSPTGRMPPSDPPPGEPLRTAGVRLPARLTRDADEAEQHMFDWAKFRESPLAEIDYSQIESRVQEWMAAQKILRYDPFVRDGDNYTTTVYCTGNLAYPVSIPADKLEPFKELLNLS